MTSILMISIFGIVVIVIPLIATLIYTHVYNKRANKIINSDFSQSIAPKKPMMSPIKFFLIWLLSMIAVFIAIIFISFVAYNNVTSINSETVSDNETINNNDFVHNFSTWFYTKDDIKDSILYDTKPSDELYGYTRKVITKGDIVFTCYEGTSHGLGNFPDFIVNIQYNGKEPLEAVMLKTSRKEFSESCFMDKPEISQDGIWIDIYDPLIFCEPPIKLDCYVLNKEQYKKSQEKDDTVNFNIEKNSELKESIKLKCNNK